MIKRKDIVWAIAISVLCAVQAMVALTASLNQVTALYHDIKLVPYLYVIGVLLLSLLFLTSILLFKRPLLACGIGSGIFTLIAIINYYELLLHGTVLTYQDIKNITTAWGQLRNYTISVTSTVGGILFSYTLILLVLALAYFRSVSLLFHRKAGALSGIVLVLFVYCMFLAPFACIKATEWSWEIHYYTDSFVVGALENIYRSFLKVNKPEGYEVKQIKDIEELPSGKNNEYPDVIMILNETYYDMDHLLDWDTDVPYMKNYTNLNAYKGYAAVPMIGGGTNASEYELLTSNSISLLNTTTPFNDLELKNSMNLADYMKQLGYATMAAHSEPSTNYHRGNAWTALGFDSVFFQPDFFDLEYYGNRYSASDSSVFSNFLRFYEAMPEDQPRFAYLLTIQNHGGWDRNDPERDTVHIGRSNGLPEYDQQRINEYLTCIQQTDDLISKIVDYYSGLDRKVVVYMVGDHGPSILKELDMDESVETILRKRQMPYFIWSNFDIDSSVLPVNPNIDLCALTPYVLRIADLPLSPYYSQLIRISEEAQCITEIVVTSENGNAFRGYMRKDGDVESIYSGSDVADMVKEYFFMEYNNFQEKERIDELFVPRTLN